jgi:hypothetical protein
MTLHYYVFARIWSDQFRKTIDETKQCCNKSYYRAYSWWAIPVKWLLLLAVYFVFVMSPDGTQCLNLLTLRRLGSLSNVIYNDSAMAKAFSSEIIHSTWSCSVGSEIPGLIKFKRGFWKVQWQGLIWQAIGPYAIHDNQHECDRVST